MGRRFHERFEINKVVEEARNLRRLVFDRPLKSEPGQFVMAWMPGVGEKPFSVMNDNPLELIIKRFGGAFTEKVFRLYPGERMFIRGPYGNSFTPFVRESGRKFLICGGCGMVPLVFLARRMQGLDIKVVMGAACREELPAVFREKGYRRPYKFEAWVNYPKIQWHGEPCYTMVFSLPSMESDLRYEELYRLGFLRLKFASGSQLKDMEELLGSISKKLTSWHGFVTSVMFENKLVPAPPSHQHQNYVISHVSESEIGSSRVDHSSTIVDRAGSINYAEYMKGELTFFANHHISLLHAIELERENYPLDKNRYTGYFDRANKWHEPLDITDIRGMKPYLVELKEAFMQGFDRNEPVPIPEKELKDFVSGLQEIDIDENMQRRIHVNMERELFK